MACGDTIAAIATAPGRSGVAVIRVSGPEALSVAQRLTAPGQRSEVRGQRLRKLFFPSSSKDDPAALHLHLAPPPSSSLIDEAVVLTFKGPHSYTGEDVVEFQCHGGVATPRRVLEACLAAGARLARRGEFTERAFLNGRLDYDQAESVLDLINARTFRAADAALEGLSGRKRRDLRTIYDLALDLSTQLEHALDIDEDELPVAFIDGVRARATALRERIGEAIRRSQEGKILREGARVVLVGPPNAGKSSLMNALLEENRAIVSDLPGTTRDSIEEGLDLDGWPIRLIDTAGLRETSDVIEAEGVKRSEELIAKADVIVSLGGLEGLGGLERVIWVHPKCDLGRGEGLNVSAKTGEGLEELKRAIVALLEKRVAEVENESDPSADRLSALHDAYAALSSLIPHPSSLDLVLVGNVLHQVAERVGSLIGAVYSEDILNNLFSRFCVGK